MSVFFERAADELRLPLRREQRKGFRAAQVAAIHSISAHFWEREDPALIVMPTGSGKTAVMVTACFALRARRALVVVPSKLLREQIATAFARLSLLKEIGALATDSLPQVQEGKNRITDSNGWEHLREADVVVATPSALSPRIDGVPHPPPDLFDVVIFDEGHHTPAKTWSAIAAAFPDAKKLLFTATPYRLDRKPIGGDLVFRYPLAQARADGVFGDLEYIPVEPTDHEGPDQAIARAAAARIEEDRAKGLRHFLLVRADGKKRAKEVLQVYEDTTDLKLALVHSGLSERTVKSRLGLLRSGELDGVVAVDMLGEGIDVPQLKVAALHAPHRSLAVTLQFIGRFARTADEVGGATFFAVPSQIEGEAARLFVADAEWNELVAGLSRARIDTEQEARSVARSFERVAEPPDSAPTNAEGILRSLRPYFHVKVYALATPPNLEAELPLPRGVKPLLDSMSSEHNARVCLGRRTSTLPWCKHGDVRDVEHALFVLVYDEPSRHLFICTTRRDIAVYDALVEAVAGSGYARLSTEEISRVLRGIEQAEFFSVGMRNRAGFGGGGGESYRMISGRNADRFVGEADALRYNRGHAFGRGAEEGEEVTIGFSSSSKVWANRRGVLAELFKWIRALAAKLVDEAPVETGSGLDRLRPPKRLTAMPTVVAAGLPKRAFSVDGLSVRVPGVLHRDVPLPDLGLEIADGSSDPILVQLKGPGALAADFSFSINRGRLFRAANGHARKMIIVEALGRAEIPAEEWFSEHPIGFLTEDLDRVDGNSIAKAPEPGEAPRVRIQGVRWAETQTDPYKEKPDGNGASLFEYVERRLKTEGATVVLCDDGAGEMADYISATETENGTKVSFIHCKAVKRGKAVPNDDVQHVYDVAGQALKTLRWTDVRRLAKQVEHRTTNTQSRFCWGNLDKLRELTTRGVAVFWEVVIVQPAVRESPRPATGHLLAGVDAYLDAGGVGPLRVWGTVAEDDEEGDDDG